MRLNNLLSHSSTDKAILKTLLYSDLFDFPLNRKELWDYLKSDKKLLKSKFLSALNNLNPDITYSRGYYCLSGREKIISKRINRIKENNKKILIARKAANLLSLIPSVHFIGISGSLSVNNAADADDIDFFIIAKRNTVFITRLLCLILLGLIGKRRHRLSADGKDRICLNMIIDETNLLFQKDRRDIYTAQEIAQLKPIYDKNNYLQKLKDTNNWILNYMPNIFSNAKIKPTKDFSNNKTTKRFRFIVSLAEKIAENLQMLFINRHKTSETISSKFLAFHPYDYRKFVLLKYKQRLQEISL